ncbi:MAG: hypothetical protein IJR90_03930, partial [Clostridia bacterium]|nr:hypothetical protein [Clostridia bacterium]
MKKTLSIVIVLVILAGVLPLWTNADGHASYVTVPLPEEASYYYQLSDANVSPVSIEIEVAENELVSLEWRRCTSLQTPDWRLIGSSIYKPGEFNGPTWKAAELMPGAYYVYVTIKYYSVSGNSYTLMGSETSDICTVNVLKMPGEELSEPLLYASAPGMSTGLADFRKSFSGEIPQLEYRALNESGEPLSEEWTENEYWDFGYIRDLAPGKYEARTMGNIITSSGTPFQFEIAEAENAYYYLEKDPEHDYVFDVKYGCADKYRDNTIRLFVMNTGNIDVSGVTCSLEENSVCTAGDGEYDIAYRYFYFVGNIPIKVKPGVEPGTYNEKLSLHVPGDETVYEVEFTVNVVQRPVKVSVRPDDASKYEGFEDPEFTFTATSDYDGFVPEVRCTFRHDGNSGGSGNYRIYAENVELLNARDDAYIKTEIVTLTGKLTVLSLPYFNFSDYLTHDGIGYYNSYNNKPVT